jgi:hypothetical protein
MFIGIVLGVVLLGLLAVFAIVLPKASGDAGELSLPDTIPGGYAAADDPDSFAGTQFEQQGKAIAADQRSNTAYGDDVLPDVLGTPAVTRSYISQDGQAVFVQAIRAAGGAFAPDSLSDPKQSQGGGGTTMQRVGDGVCILTYSAPQAGQPAQDASEPSDVRCQVSREELTVQIHAAGIGASDLVKAADAVADDLD